MRRRTNKMGLFNKGKLVLKFKNKRGFVTAKKDNKLYVLIYHYNHNGVEEVIRNVYGDLMKLKEDYIILRIKLQGGENKIAIDEQEHEVLPEE